MAVGTYEAAERFPFQSAGRPGLNLSGMGRGCNTVSSRFGVLEAVYDNGGKVLSFAARFEQHCDGEDPGLRGKIFYQAEFPFCHSTLQPDFNGDCIFNLIDLAHLSALWLINYERAIASGL